jgi:hypothetical protein
MQFQSLDRVRISLDISMPTRVRAFVAWRRKQNCFPKQSASSKIRSWTKYRKKNTSVSHRPLWESCRVECTEYYVGLCWYMSHHCITEHWYEHGRWRNALYKWPIYHFCRRAKSDKNRARQMEVNEKICKHALRDHHVLSLHHCYSSRCEILSVALLIAHNRVNQHI